MENYREGKKVKHRIISNLSKWPEHLVAGLDKLLKGEKINTVDDLQPSLGKSFGAILTVLEISKRLGIKQALGNTTKSSLALFQIAGRIISQGSRNYLANQWVKGQAVEEVFKLKKINEDKLYSNLVWLSQNQQTIERKIYKYRCKDKPVKEIFLYDVTSSYLEGNQNELAAYGYNRDKKKGKKQIVIVVSIEIVRRIISVSGTPSMDLLPNTHLSKGWIPDSISLSQIKFSFSRRPTVF